MTARGVSHRVRVIHGRPQTDEQAGDHDGDQGDPDRIEGLGIIAAGIALILLLWWIW